MVAPGASQRNPGYKGHLTTNPERIEEYPLSGANKNVYAIDIYGKRVDETRKYRHVVSCDYEQNVLYFHFLLF